MRIKLSEILKNGIWMLIPPLIFGLCFMNLLPVVLKPELFNSGIPDVLLYTENITRILVFAMPVFFSLGISANSQKWGLVLYLAGVIFYFLSYAALIIYPESGWSTGMIGFTATAYSNIFWMTGLGLLGEKFCFASRIRYRSLYYFVPVIIFLIVHTTHAIIVYQRSF